MSNIIIFSKHDLIRFYFKGLTTSILNKKPDNNEVTIKICHTLSEFNTVISESNDAHIILDADEINRSDMFYMLFLLNNENKRFKLFLVLKNKNSLNYFSELKKTPIIFICKDSPQVVLEKTLEDFFLNPKTKKNELKSNNKLRKFNKLTPREEQVIFYLLKGLSNSEIADILSVNYKTASSHRMSIYKKYNVNNSMGLYLHPELHRHLT